MAGRAPVATITFGHTGEEEGREDRRRRVRCKLEAG